jgi:2-polyprenyl-3-methyl-5-hydroxy-6-metoxy-1,4-benzoquinol methylase
VVLLRISETWDREYQDGTWSYLRGITECARYSVIAGYVSFYCSEPSVLDVGCGEALLLPHFSLPPKSYVGVDCSRFAVDSNQLAKRFKFVCETAERYTPEIGETFDAVIFNEILYYLENPIAILERYASFLRPDGIVVVSMHRSDESILQIVEHIWCQLDNGPWLKLDETRITNIAKSLIWDVRAMKPK